MNITCWGARGSIPVSGADFMKYGGDTTCIEVTSAGGDVVIIDAGTGIRRLGNSLAASAPRTLNLLFTHAHWDHLMGFPFFKPIYIPGTELRLYGCPPVHQTVTDLMARTMTAPYFPVEFGQLQSRISAHDVCGRAFEIGSIQIAVMPLSHPNQGIGYKFTENGKSFVFLTDNELTVRHPGGAEFDDYVRFAAGADLLIHDAEYTDSQYAATKGWGHSVYTDALRLALAAEAKQFGLFHHNQDRADAELDSMVDHCRVLIKDARSDMGCLAASPGLQIDL